MGSVDAFAAFRLGRRIEAEHNGGDLSPVGSIRRRIQKAGVRRQMPPVVVGEVVARRRRFINRG